MTDELPSKVVRSNGTHEVLAHAVKVVNPHLLDGTFGRYAANEDGRLEYSCSKERTILQFL
jgi:hypothetical protein